MSNPEWCDIKDWKPITEEAVDYVFQEASLRLKDGLEANLDLKDWCSKLFIAQITLLSGLSAYLATYVTGPLIGSAVLVSLAVAINLYILWGSVKPHNNLPMEGRSPKILLKMDMCGGNTLDSVKLAEIFTKQEAIDIISADNDRIAEILEKSLKLLAFFPAFAAAGAALVVFVT